jgi:tellurite resistance protein TehA-like permease
MFGPPFVQDLTIFLFALTGGLTLSGIIANIYRMVARKPKNRGETVIYYAVMAFAGASVLLENATRSYRKKDCSAPAYGFAIAIVGYWCFILGLGILSVVVRLKHS